MGRDHVREAAVRALGAAAAVDLTVHQVRDQRELLRRRRLGVGLSQEELSARAGLHRTYVGLLERGLRMPSIRVAKVVAEALGTTMAELLGEVDRHEVRAGRRTGRRG